MVSENYGPLPTDGRNPAPPRKPCNTGSPVNTSKQWFPMVSTWCEMDPAASGAPGSLELGLALQRSPVELALQRRLQLDRHSRRTRTRLLQGRRDLAMLPFASLPNRGSPLRSICVQFSPRQELTLIQILGRFLLFCAAWLVLPEDSLLLSSYPGSPHQQFLLNVRYVHGLQGF